MRWDCVHQAPDGSLGPCFLFPFAYSCHQFCIGCCLGPHVLVLGQVYEDTEDAGGNIEGQGEPGPLLGSLWHLGSWTWGSCSPEHSVMLWSEQWVQQTTAIQDVDSQQVPLCVFIKFGKNGTAPLALDTPRQQQSQAETDTHTFHGQDSVCKERREQKISQLCNWRVSHSNGTIVIFFFALQGRKKPSENYKPLKS